MAVAGVGGEGGRGGGEGGGVVHGPVEQRLRAGRVAEVALDLGSHLWEREGHMVSTELQGAGLQI